eukprot:6203425-Pleurochrysis_carterae.AAC.2
MEAVHGIFCCTRHCYLPEKEVLSLREAGPGQHSVHGTLCQARPFEGIYPPQSTNEKASRRTISS